MIRLSNYLYVCSFIYCIAVVICKIIFLSDLVGTCKEPLKMLENYLATIYFDAALYKVPASPFLSTQKFDTDRHGSRKITLKKYINSQSFEQYILNAIGHLDTITKDDALKKQYESLPYPAVSVSAIEQEELHYKQNIKSLQNLRPFVIWPAIALEQINHFLFQGSNTFVYVISKTKYKYLSCYCSIHIWKY